MHVSLGQQVDAVGVKIVEGDLEVSVDAPSPHEHRIPGYTK